VEQGGAARIHLYQRASLSLPNPSLITGQRWCRGGAERVNSYRDKRVAAVNKSEKDKSYLSGQDTRLLLMIFADFIAICPKVTIDTHPV
jgi:hypothetical protein